MSTLVSSSQMVESVEDKYHTFSDFVDEEASNYLSEERIEQAKEAIKDGALIRTHELEQGTKEALVRLNDLSEKHSKKII